MAASELDEIFRPLFSYGAHLAKAASTWNADPPEAETIRNDLERLIAIALSRRTFVGDSRFDDAWFAVSAWLDEKTLSVLAPSPGEKPQALQRRFFNTMNAGEEFFDKLEALLRDAGGEDADNRRRETLNIYATCLELGFRGKYFRYEDQPALEGLRLRCLAEIAGGAGTAGAERGLFGAYETAGDKRDGKESMLVFWIVPAAATAILYAALRLFMSDFYLNLLASG